MSAPTLTMHGIKNCDTVKKARAWLDERGIQYAFHDYKSAGVDRAQLESWTREVGWEAVLNRSGTTFRKLDPTETTGLDAERAVALMLAHPSAIKRPILTGRQRLVVGFKPDAYAREFA